MKRLLNIVVLLVCVSSLMGQTSYNDSLQLKNEVTQVADTSRTMRVGKNQIVVSSKEEQKEINIYFSEKNRHKDSNKPFSGHLFGVDLGFNNYLNKDNSTVLPSEYRFLDVNSGRSLGITIHVTQKSFQLDKKGNVGFVAGLGLEFNNYRFAGNYKLVEDAHGNIASQRIFDDVEKNKFTTLYLTVPLLFELQGFRNISGDVGYLSVGLVGGVRLSSHTKTVYSNGEKDKDHGAYNLNDFRYGLMFRTGYKIVNLFGVYYPTPLFKKSGDPELYPFCVGFSFLPDWM